MSDKSVFTEILLPRDASPEEETAFLVEFKKEIGFLNQLVRESIKFVAVHLPKQHFGDKVEFVVPEGKPEDKGYLKFTDLTEEERKEREDMAIPMAEAIAFLYKRSKVYQKKESLTRQDVDNFIHDICHVYLEKLSALNKDNLDLFKGFIEYLLGTARERVLKKMEGESLTREELDRMYAEIKSDLRLFEPGEGQEEEVSSEPSEPAKVADAGEGETTIVELEEIFRKIRPELTNLVDPKGEEGDSLTKPREMEGSENPEVICLPDNSRK